MPAKTDSEIHKRDIWRKSDFILPEGRFEDISDYMKAFSDTNIVIFKELEKTELLSREGKDNFSVYCKTEYEDILLNPENGIGYFYLPGLLYAEKIVGMCPINPEGCNIIVLKNRY